MEKKRTRVQLSCTACRARKLKCCRTHPCTNCLKRNEAGTCTFVGRGPRGKISSNGRTSPAHVQDRLQHLENLILSFTQQQQQQQQQQEKPDSVGEHQQVINNGGQITPASSVPPSLSFGDVQQAQKEGESETPPPDPGRLVVGETGMRYIDGAHWTAILEEISGVKEYLRDNEEMGLSDEEGEDEEMVRPSNAPTLLLGLHQEMTMDELLDGLPARPVVDRVVAMFVSLNEPTTVMVHFPTFQKQYNQFWSRPKEASVSWLALLYAALTITMSVYMRTGEPLPAEFGEATEAVQRLRHLTAQCLVQSNYTVPGRFKVEALFFYTMCEFFRSEDAQVGVSFLLNMTIRLAMRSGYHRDPQQFPNISPFEGEMRRRVWAIMRQLDVLISFQVGVPRGIQDWQQDVEPPRNISDEEFGESTVELPPSRPETELTTTSYIRGKSRLMAIFGKISDLAYSRDPMTYDEILALDRQLEEARDLVPHAFKIRPLDQCFVDSSYLILRRYTLELLYQKARCVLHRRYLGEVHTNPRYAYSRWVCMSASKEILRHQADIYHETQPGGLLYRDRQFPNSLQTADYLLAAMIICLDLSQNPTGTPPGSTDEDVIRGREELLSTIETSHRIFEQQRRRSADAQKAYAALTIMLRRLKAQKLDSEQLASAQQQPYGSSNGQSYPVVDTMGITPEYQSLDVIGEMLDAPTNLDWNLWDQHMQSVADMGSTIQKRPFLSSFLPNSDSASKTRHLTATRTLPHPPAPLFDIISSVESYSSFLPFLTASTVTHRDPTTNYPTRAFLTVGYGPLSETFTSKVTCDPENWVVEAQSGAKYGVGKKDGQGFPGEDEGLFEYLSTRWELESQGEGKGTVVRLDIRFEFRSQLHAAMMGAVEGQMAGVMVEAFEKRIYDVLGRA
ncbi:hypothetical protein AnigIFM56816_003072 [Aspergillus niger]|nr:hypothetical protein AnigIFM56816_003072 [Aspergillus niger]